MTHSMPFVVRTARPILKRPAYGVLALLVAAFPTVVGIDDQGIAAVFIWLYGMLAAGLTFRRLDDDQSTGTIEQLEMLPVPRWRIALETAAGALIAFAPYLAVVLAGAMARPVGRYGASPSWFFSCAPPWIIGAVLLATLVSLRHAMRWPARIAGGLGLGALLYRGCPVLIPPSHWEPSELAVRSFYLVLAELALWAVLWRVGSALGGGWSAAESATRPRETPAPCGCPIFGRGVPDALNPLFWRELTSGARLVALATLVGLGFVVAGVGHGERPMLTAMAQVWWMLAWACAASAYRTGRDRTSGVWDDVAVTPLSRRSLLWGRMLALTLQGVAVAAVLLGTGFLLSDVPGRSQCGELAVGILGIPLIGVPAAALAGFCAGISGRGVTAAVAGLLLFYFGGLFAFTPGAYAGMYLRVDRYLSGDLCGLLFFASALVTYFGTLSFAALRGIRLAVAEQRA